MQLFHYITAALLSPFITTNMMDSFDPPFTIEINGKPIAKVSDSDQSRTQAKVGAAGDAAVFKLQDGSLSCGDWMLGRNKTEDRSFLPKQVLWFKVNGKGEDTDSKEQILPIALEKSGDAYKPKFNGMHSWTICPCRAIRLADRSTRCSLDRGGWQRLCESHGRQVFCTRDSQLVADGLDRTRDCDGEDTIVGALSISIAQDDVAESGRVGVAVVRQMQQIWETIST